MKKVYSILLPDPDGKNHLGVPGVDGRVNIKINIKDVACDAILLLSFDHGTIYV